MIFKKYNETNYIFIDKNNYVNKKHYYEELIKLKFNKSYLTNNIIDELNSKIKKHIKNKV
jgi:hypothetical protein